MKMCTYIFSLCAFVPFNMNASEADNVTIPQILDLYDSIMLIEGAVQKELPSLYQRELAQTFRDQIGTISQTISDYKDHKKEFDVLATADQFFKPQIPNIRSALEKVLNIIDDYLKKLDPKISAKIRQEVGEELAKAKTLTKKQWIIAKPETEGGRRMLPLKPRIPAPRPERPAPRPERPLEAVEPAPLQQKPESAAPEPESPKTWKRAAKEEGEQAKRALGQYYRRTRQITPAELKELAEQYKQQVK